MVNFNGTNDQKRGILLARIPQFLKNCSTDELDGIFDIFSNKYHSIYVEQNGVGQNFCIEKVSSDDNVFEMLCTNMNDLTIKDPPKND